MNSQLGAYVSEARQRMGWSRQELARRIGYKNLNKGARRIERVENQGPYETALFWEIVGALKLDHEEIKKRVALDHKAYEASLDEPVPMKMIVRLIPAAYFSHTLPGNINPHEEAKAYAVEYAKCHRRKVCLVLSRRYSYWVDESGKGFMNETTREKPSNSPYMRISGSGEKFLLAMPDNEKGNRLIACRSLSDNPIRVKYNNQRSWLKNE